MKTCAESAAPQVSIPKNAPQDKSARGDKKRPAEGVRSGVSVNRFKRQKSELLHFEVGVDSVVVGVRLAFSLTRLSLSLRRLILLRAFVERFAHGVRSLFEFGERGLDLVGVVRLARFARLLDRRVERGFIFRTQLVGVLFEQLFELWGMNLETQAESKKNLAQLTAR